MRIVSIVFLFIFTSCSQAQKSGNINQTDTKINVMAETDSSNWNDLSPEEERVIVNKGTEMAFTGAYVNNKKNGVYTCKRCNSPLFRSESKFNSGTGWPSFDDMIADNVLEIPDADGHRTEIVCANCKGHLGHVFYGEGFTGKNTRHCVNSISLNFMEQKEVEKVLDENLDTAIFASGCFWGTEYFMEQAEGVIDTQVGYIGGTKENPTYKEVCTGTTGHAEAVRVIYNTKKTDYETLCKLFFETHDPTQVDRQGPDIGTQYRTEIFFLNENQREIAERLKAELEADGLKIATKITKATTFWEGEDYHEHYYQKKGSTPYCHRYIKRF